MGLFDFFNNDSSGRDEVYKLDPNASEHHKAKISHELVGGAAGFEAMKLYEEHCRQNGQPANHALAKELLAGFATAEVDRLIETKGLDSVDREKAKHHARQQAEQALNQSGQFGGGGSGGYGDPQEGYAGQQRGFEGRQGGYGGEQDGYSGQQGYGGGNREVRDGPPSNEFGRGGYEGEGGGYGGGSGRGY